MKALYYPAHDQLVMADLPLPVAAPEEVLVKVSACGICSSEIETFKSHSDRRTPPLVMGHEFCGVVAETGTDVSGFSPGARVVSNSVVSCGICTACRQGRSNLCANRQIFGMHRPGAFAAYVNVPERCLVPMPDQLTPEQACLTEPLANGVHMVNLTRHIAPENVLVIGAGAIGLLAQQAFQQMTGASVTVADLKPERLAIARKNGAAATINPSETDLVQAVSQLTGYQGMDVVIDAVGTSTTNRQTLEATRPGGTAVLIGLYENSRSLLSYDIILPEKHVTGTYAATDAEISQAVALLATGRIDVSSWVHYYPHNEGVRAFREMLESKNGHIKSVITYP